VANLAEPGGWTGAYPLGGRVRRAQLRILFLERDQVAEEVVVLGIRDLRVVQDVIAVVVVLEQLSKLGRSLRSIAPAHPRPCH
jgi:hypothetical protein